MIMKTSAFFRIVTAFAFLTLFAASAFAQEITIEKSTKKTNAELYAGFSYDNTGDDFSFIYLGLTGIYDLSHGNQYFIDMGLNFGINDGKDMFLLNFTPGLRLNTNDRGNFNLFVDIGAGPGAFANFDKEDFNTGLNTMLRLGLGYKNFGIHFGNQFLFGPNVNFSNTTVSIYWRF